MVFLLEIQYTSRGRILKWFMYTFENPCVTSVINQNNRNFLGKRTRAIFVAGFVLTVVQDLARIWRNPVAAWSAGNKAQTKHDGNKKTFVHASSLRWFDECFPIEETLLYSCDGVNYKARDSSDLHSDFDAKKPAYSLAA